MATYPRGRLVSGRGEYLGGTRYRFHCPQGHTHVKDMGKGKITKRLSVQACQMFARYWAQRINFVCPQCERARGAKG